MSGSRLCEGDPDELIECPFDPVHLLRRKRMPYHIIKCGKVCVCGGGGGGGGRVQCLIFALCLAEL